MNLILVFKKNKKPYSSPKVNYSNFNNLALLVKNNQEYKKKFSLINQLEK
jgi:hypothetical protein